MEEIKYYLVIWGVRVSGYIQYSSVKLIEGLNLDNAFNGEYLDNPPKGDCVVLEVYEIDMSRVCGLFNEPSPELRRLI